MKFSFEKNLVELTPENEAETKNLDALWKVIVDCVKFNKKLVPIGEFVPGKTQVARFAVEE
jgi:hypothetical protein